MMALTDEDRKYIEDVIQKNLQLVSSNISRIENTTSELHRSVRGHNGDLGLAAQVRGNTDSISRMEKSMSDSRSWQAAHMAEHSVLNAQLATHNALDKREADKASSFGSWDWFRDKIVMIVVIILLTAITNALLVTAAGVITYTP
jgi:hypothetical protein